MIKFSCDSCGQPVGAPDRYAGKRVRCPKCKGPTRVPQAKSRADDGIIRFRCPHCEQKIGLTEKYAGKVVSCAKCKGKIRVPGSSRPTGASRPTAPVPPPPPPPPPPLPLDDGLDMDGLEGFPEGAGGDEYGLAPLEPEVQLMVDDDSAEDWSDCGDAPAPDGGPLQDGGRGGMWLKIAIGAGAAVVLFAVILIVALSIAGGSRREEPTVTEEVELDNPVARQVAEECIDHLVKGNIDEVASLINPQRWSYLNREGIEELSDFLSQSEVQSVDYVRTWGMEIVESGSYFIFYKLEYAKETREVVVLVTGSGSTSVRGRYWVEDAAAVDDYGDSVGMGALDFESIETLAANMEMAGEWLPAILGACCAFWFVFLILGIVMIVASWMVLEKVGQPGWAVLIPFYGPWVLGEAAGYTGWYGLGMIFAGAIPAVGQLVQLALWGLLCVGISQNLGRSTLFGLGMAILPFIFWPIAAFSRK